jgi:hypothetical protein
MALSVSIMPFKARFICCRNSCFSDVRQSDVKHLRLLISRCNGCAALLQSSLAKRGAKVVVSGHIAELQGQALQSYIRR